MLKRIFFLLSFFLCSLPGAASARETASLDVRAVQQFPDGVDRILKFTVANLSDRDVVVGGRIIVINVYGASLPVSLPLELAVVPANGTTGFSVRWHDTPVIGQIRMTLVLNEGSAGASISSYTFWLLPNGKAAGGGAIALLASIAIAHLVMRGKKQNPGNTQKPSDPGRTLGKPVKAKPLSSTLAYVVEPEDSLMSLSVRFDTAWQEIVRANRLKPPYALKPGKTIRIPRHPLKHKPPVALD